VRARSLNTPGRPTVAPRGGRVRGGIPSLFGRSPARLAAAVLAAGALTGGLAACGGSGTPSAQSLLADTLASQTPIQSGSIWLSLSLTPLGAGGSPLGGEGFTLELSGPFQGAGQGRLPSFALQLDLAAGGRSLTAGATATGGRLFIELAGTPYLAPPAVASSLEQGYALAGGGGAGAAGRSPLGALGVEPGEWLKSPVVVGSASVGGVQTVHVTSPLDLQRFAADAPRLAASLGTIALGLPGREARPLSAARLAALLGSVSAGRVDLYTGSRDHLLRRLTLNALLSPRPSSDAVPGAPTGTWRLTLDLRLADVNAPQSIAAPADPRPSSLLVEALEGAHGR